MQKLSSVGKFHDVSANGLREGFRDALFIRTEAVARLVSRAALDTLLRSLSERRGQKGRQPKGFPNRQLRDSWVAGSRRPAMLTKMTDADWITVLKVFEASRSRRAQLDQTDTGISPSSPHLVGRTGGDCQHGETRIARNLSSRSNSRR